MYRVYDKKEKIWIRENIYLSPDNDLYISKKSWFGREKLTLAPSIRYVWQEDVGLSDKNGVWIFEGDICKCAKENGEIFNSVVTYDANLCSYILLDFNSNMYYYLNDKYSDNVEVIGNVLENPIATNFEEIIDATGIDEDWEMK